LGIDIGGTFTDFALVDDETGRTAVHKQLTTPQDPSQAVLNGVERLLADRKVPIAEVSALVHGTTLVTNAVIERKGAVTGMLTTAGFADVLDIGKERRYDLYDLRLSFQAPLVPRTLRREVRERLRDDGKVVQAPDLAQVKASVAGLIEAHRIESLAVCFMHSYLNPAHEEQVHAMLAREFPSLYVSTSADICPFIREFERFTTTTVNAFVQPVVDRYLKRIEDGLSKLGFRGRLYIMTSSGGTVTPETARRYPVRMLESGPSAGILMSASVGRSLALPNLLAFDMGGTTAKGALIRDALPQKKYEMEVARMHDFKRGSGLPVQTAVVDMIEIGSGGGSLAEVDERGLIRVGPRSAGAEPGPACYGRGGTRAAVTDADLTLGYLDPAFFAGGSVGLDRAASERAILGSVGLPLGLDSTKAAWGIHEIANEDIARAFRIHASERGVDFRGCSMVAFGGAGPVHAVRVAGKLKIPTVILPLGAGVFSAFGLLASPLCFDVMRTLRVSLDELTPARLADEFRPLIDEASGLLRTAGVPESQIQVTRRLDMRYKGQGFEVEVVLPGGADAEAAVRELPTLFARSYEQVFSVSLIDEPIELVNWKVEVAGPRPKVELRQGLGERQGAGEALKGRRQAYFPEANGYVECAVYNRYAMRPGAAIEGPALVEEREATCVVGIGHTARIDEFYNLVVTLRSEEGKA
jgi:N-methylhydantoinase A